jgi:hypothetical protein
MSDSSLRKPQKKSPATGSSADSGDEPWLGRAQVRQIAEAMMRDSPVEVIRGRPAELARLYASMVLIQKKSEEDRLTPQQRLIVDARAHTNMIEPIHLRMRPDVRIREEVDKAAERGNDREPQR